MKKLHRSLKPIPLLATMYVLLCGGPFGTEGIISSSGPALAIIVLTLMAFLWAAPYGLIVAELVTKIPMQGGIYQWFRASLSPFWSFQITFLDWLTWVMDAALYPPLVAAYFLTELLGGTEGNRMLAWSICLVVIWFCIWLNIRGVKDVGRLSMVMAFVQITPVLVLIVMGWRHLNFSQMSMVLPEGESFSTALHWALIWSLWNYSGYAALASASEEIVEPEKSYPRVLAAFIPISAVVYVLPLVVMLGVIPDWTGIEEGSLNTAAAAIGGGVLLTFMLIAAQFSNLGLFNSEQLIISRVPFAMARDGVLPPWLTELHPKYGTPARILIIQGFVYSALTYWFGFAELLEVSTWLALPPYILTFSVVIILRWKRPQLRGRFEIPGGWPVIIVTAAVPSLIAFYVMFTITWSMLVWALSFMIFGPLLYFWCRWHNRRAGIERKEESGP